MTIKKPKKISPEPQSQTVAVNDIELEVIIAGRGNPKFAILLHGFPETNYSWREQIPYLVEMGYEIYAPNMRGYGQSSKPPLISDYDIGHLTDDVAALIDIGAQGREVTLVGHDWGAAVAWAFAIQRKRQLKHLIVMNVPHPSIMRAGLKTWAQMKKSWYIFFFQLPKIPEWRILKDNAIAITKVFRGAAVDKSKFPDEVCKVYRDNALIPGAMTAMINYYRAALSGLRGANGPKLPKIEIPVLMIWGEADKALGIELTQGYEGVRYSDLVEDFTLKTLPNVSHWVQQEAPDAVNAIMGEWLKLK
ncbi:MAG: alpha/beta hydrolase fold protein [Hyphomonadaceae bacterium]|nr:MAG: alpha/beta hydrolase fold protein [Hyphomonadaceae bacterium]KAF0184782.1 MAG: alpha/beta hydrolase fold protein [Hyphomonadaceae bacterium]